MRMLVLLPTFSLVNRYYYIKYYLRSCVNESSIFYTLKENVEITNNWILIAGNWSLRNWSLKNQSLRNRSLIYESLTNISHHPNSFIPTLHYSKIELVWAREHAHEVHRRIRFCRLPAKEYHTLCRSTPSR